MGHSYSGSWRTGLGNWTAANRPAGSLCRKNRGATCPHGCIPFPAGLRHDVLFKYHEQYRYQHGAHSPWHVDPPRTLERSLHYYRIGRVYSVVPACFNTTQRNCFQYGTNRTKGFPDWGALDRVTWAGHHRGVGTAGHLVLIGWCGGLWLEPAGAY